MSKKSKGKNFVAPVIIGVLLIGLIVAVVFAVTGNNKLKKANEDYEKLTSSYDSLGKELLSARNDSINLEKEIDDKNAEIEELEEVIANYQEALKYTEKNIYLSEFHYLLDKSTNILEAVEADAINVDSSQYYAFYSDDEDAVISFYSKSGLIETNTYGKGETHFIKMPEKCDYISLNRDSNMYLVSTGINTADNSILENRHLYVVSANSPASVSISDAVEKVKETGTIVVFPGVYEDNVSVREKEVNIQGLNREICILRSSDNDYTNPPLEISAGKVSNMTIETVGENVTISGTSKYSYAVHSDFNYMYGRDLTFENCNISSDYNAGAGIGLRGEGTLTFKNCILSGYYHGLYVHDSKETDFGGKQKLVVDSCELIGLNGDVAFALSSCDVEAAEVWVEFKNNTLTNISAPGSENLFAAVNDDLNNYDGFYMGLKNFHLDESSAGNNVDKLNY